MRRAFKTLVADNTVGLVLFSRLITLVGAPVTLYLVAATRSPAEQGFYFVFANVQAIAALFEFGVGTMVVQFVSHAAAGLSWNEERKLVGPPQRLEELWRVLHDAERWFAFVSVGLAIILVPGGLLFFQGESARSSIAHVAPWLTIIASLSLYLLVVPALCALEGCGLLSRVQRMRVLQAAVSVTIMWIGIPTVGSLIAAGIASVSQFVIAGVWLPLAFPGFVHQWRRAALNPRGAMPNRAFIQAQSRTGAYWLIGFLGPQMLTPIVFAFQGAPAAGRIGLSLAVATAPLTIALSWLQARYPDFGAHAARGDLTKLEDVARHATIQALLVCVAGELALLSVVRALQIYVPQLGMRFLSLSAVAALAIAIVATLLYQAMAAYLRAHREEALLWPLMVGTAATILFSIVAAPIRADYAAYAYCAGITFVFFPLTALVFLRRRQALHAAPVRGRGFPEVPRS